MKDKLDLIDEYLGKIEANFNYQLSQEIAESFQNDIPGIKRSWKLMGSSIESIKMNKPIFQGMLLNYRANLIMQEKDKEYELEKLRLQQPLINNTLSSSTSMNIEINVSNVIENINGLDNDILGSKDKIYITSKLKELENIKKTADKNELWLKLKPILKWCIDKGIDVVISVLPYLLSIVSESR